MNRLAFAIGRTPSYRTLGPIIESALGDGGWDVELILGPPFPPGHWKAYQNPTRENVPARLIGRCETVVVESTSELTARLNKADAVIADVGRAFLTGDDTASAGSLLWCAVFDADHSADPLHCFGDAAISCWPTSYYVDLAVENRVADREELARRARIVGYARADALKLTSPERTRREWGLDFQRPVVLYIPDGYRFWQAESHVTPWYRHVWCVDRRLARLLRAVVFRRSVRAIGEALTERGGHDAVLRTLRRFCDRQNAQLVFAPRREKHRQKRRSFTRAEMESADYIIAEEVLYPQTLLRAVQMADMAVCPYRSGSVLDGLSAGVPYVTVGLPLRAYSGKVQRFVRRFDQSVGHQPGATWAISSDEFLTSFAERSIEEFKIEPRVLERARARYVGAVDGKCSERILSIVRSQLQAR